MQGEYDLRGLAKIMAFMRAVSIIMVLMHFYWFCYGFFAERGWTLPVINNILSNFTPLLVLRVGSRASASPTTPKPLQVILFTFFYNNHF